MFPRRKSNTRFIFTAIEHYYIQHSVDYDKELLLCSFLYVANRKDYNDARKVFTDKERLIKAISMIRSKGKRLLKQLGLKTIEPNYHYKIEKINTILTKNNVILLNGVLDMGGENETS